MTKKKDEKQQPEKPEHETSEVGPGQGPTETAAQAIDNPAQTLLEGADTGRETIEPVEEVIEEHTPATLPPQRGIDELFQRFDAFENKVISYMTKPESSQPEPEVIPNEPAPAQERTPAQEPTPDRPKRKRIKLFR